MLKLFTIVATVALLAGCASTDTKTTSDRSDVKNAEVRTGTRLPRVIRTASRSFPVRIISRTPTARSVTRLAATDTRGPGRLPGPGPAAPQSSNIRVLSDFSSSLSLAARSNSRFRAASSMSFSSFLIRFSMSFGPNSSY